MLPVYVLDTDILSLFETKNPSVLKRVFATPPDQRAITAITVRERIDGWYGLLGRAKTSEQEERVYARLVETVKICAAMNVLPYTQADIAKFQELQTMKLNVRPMDLRIASIALLNGATLVTRNVRDFARIPDLALENWASET